MGGGERRGGAVSRGGERHFPEETGDTVPGKNKKSIWGKCLLYFSNSIHFSSANQLTFILKDLILREK